MTEKFDPDATIEQIKKHFPKTDFSLWVNLTSLLETELDNQSHLFKPENMKIDPPAPPNIAPIKNMEEWYSNYLDHISKSDNPSDYSYTSQHEPGSVYVNFENFLRFRIKSVAEHAGPRTATIVGKLMTATLMGVQSYAEDDLPNMGFRKNRFRNINEVKKQVEAACRIAAEKYTM